MSIVPLSTEALGIQHSAPAGSDLTGIRAANGPAVFSSERQVLVHPEEAGDGGGLFLPSDDVAPTNNHAYCTHIQLFSSAAFAWTIYVTSGLGDGSATTLDNPNKDQAIATGSDNSHVRTNVELLPGQAIRIVTTTATADVYAIVHFSETSGDSGRLIS